MSSKLEWIDTWEPQPHHPFEQWYMAHEPLASALKARAELERKMITKSQINKWYKELADQLLAREDWVSIHDRTKAY